MIGFLSNENAHLLAAFVAIDLEANDQTFGLFIACEINDFVALVKHSLNGLFKGGFESGLNNNFFNFHVFYEEISLFTLLYTSVPILEKII